MSIDRRRFHLASLAALAGGTHALAAQDSPPAVHSARTQRRDTACTTRGALALSASAARLR